MTTRGIHLTGACGAGISTLGAALADALGWTHLDTDDFFWLPIEPPFHARRPADERAAMLRQAIDAAPPGWTLSGSMDTWAQPFIPFFERVVFVDTPTDLRLARLRARESERFGAAIEPGGAMHQTHLDLIELAADYDKGGGRLPGRNRPRHEAWFASLPCPVLRVDGSRPVNALTAEILATRS